MNLLLLARDAQEGQASTFAGGNPRSAAVADCEAIRLALEFPVGCEPVTERTPRRVLTSLRWENHRAAWVEVRPETDLPG